MALRQRHDVPQDHVARQAHHIKDQLGNVLVLLPLMRLPQGTEGVLRESVAPARSLPPAWQPRAMGALLALAYHLVR